MYNTILLKVFKKVKQLLIYFEFYDQENILREKLAYEKEIERLKQEIDLAKESNIVKSESNVELPVTENKFKETYSLNHVHDDDEMVSKYLIS